MHGKATLPPGDDVEHLVVPDQGGAFVVLPAGLPVRQHQLWEERQVAASLYVLRTTVDVLSHLQVAPQQSFVKRQPDPRPAPAHVGRDLEGNRAL